mmetsp:Transcript_36927/g.85852  ORF Transcript_36927/g.85852 Transcript_36927/m.85852 type:complete len:318 (-) Transcript_36927:1030-1983(-)
MQTDGVLVDEGARVAAERAQVESVLDRGEHERDDDEDDPDGENGETERRLERVVLHREDLRPPCRHLPPHLSRKVQRGELGEVGADAVGGARHGVDGAPDAAQVVPAAELDVEPHAAGQRGRRRRRGGVELQGHLDEVGCDAGAVSVGQLHVQWLRRVPRDDLEKDGGGDLGGGGGDAGVRVDRRREPDGADVGVRALRREARVMLDESVGREGEVVGADGDVVRLHHQPCLAPDGDGDLAVHVERVLSGLVLRQEGSGDGLEGEEGGVDEGLRRGEGGGLQQTSSARQCTCLLDEDGRLDRGGGAKHVGDAPHERA